MAKYLFTSPRLGFRKWKKKDIMPFSEINSDNRVMEHFPNILSVDETVAYVKRIKEHFQQHGFGLYAVDSLSKGKFIGSIGFQNVSFESTFTPAIEILYRLHPDFWGFGLGTEGAMRCVQFGFEELKLNEVVSFTALENKKSAHVMEKIGMTRVGLFEHPKLEDGHLLKTHVLYKITRED